MGRRSIRRRASGTGRCPFSGWELIGKADWLPALRFLERSYGRRKSEVGKGNPVVLSVWGDPHLRRKNFATLCATKKVTSTQTRYHPMAHETIRVLAREENRAQAASEDSPPDVASKTRKNHSEAAHSVK